jgi:hypothetical protein
VLVGKVTEIHEDLLLFEHDWTEHAEFSRE